MTSDGDPSIILTNDDGISSSGIRAVYERLDRIGDVTVVAPSTDNSGVGRALSKGREVPLRFDDDSQSIDLSPPDYSWEVSFRDHELGYEVAGTPADCVVAAVSGLGLDPDIVVSGCNPGPNVGMSVIGRSGTTSAAIEAAHFGIPGIAVSRVSFEPEQDDFHVESDFVSQLVQFSLHTGLFNTVDYLNVQVPSSEPERVEITEPSERHNTSADVDTSKNRFVFSHVGEKKEEVPGTDRHAIRQDAASISPLTIRNGPVETDRLRDFAERYEPA